MISRPSDRARFGPFEVDLHTHELWKFGTRLKLVGQPFEILAVLLQSAGELVTRDELRTRLWPSDTFVDFNHGLNAAVNKLRDTLNDSADAPRYVETLPRRGYRFIAQVEWIDARAPVATQTEPPSKPTPEPAFELDPEPAIVAAPTRSVWPRYLMGAGALCIALILAAVLLHTLMGFRGVTPAQAMVEHTRPLLSISDTSTPSFSPDGNSIAFYRQHSAEGDGGIYAGPVGGDHPLKLTSNDRDSCPVWSPDGRLIAFTRNVANDTFTIHIISADGGVQEKRDAEKKVETQSASLTLTSSASADRELSTGGVKLTHPEIDWSPDGKQIAFAGSSGIYVLSLADSTVRSMTQSPPMSFDWGPSFSPDGSSILFVRSRQVAADELWSIPVAGGAPEHIFTERGKLASTPQWSYDGRSIIFSSNRTGHPALWRVQLDSPNEAAQIPESGSPAWDPAVSRRGYRLAYERLLRSLSIWQIDLTSDDKRPYLSVSSTSDTDQGPGPQFSPDGNKLAYMSDRGGTMEIWIANRDGSNAFQLTAVGGAGTPRWSPDSQAVAFDVLGQGGEKIVTMNLHGGAPQTIAEGIVPSWSHDGKWIYFVSARSGNWQVYKVPAHGGDAIQITQHGGHAALESFDGKYLYYAKNANPEPEIWRVPVNGGEEIPIALVHPGTWASFQVTEKGILFVGPSIGHQAVLNFYDFAQSRTTSVTVLNRTPFWLGATPDGKTVAFDQPGQEQSQAMLVENFR